MYIESLSVNQFRCFETAEMKFQYPGRRHGSRPAPRLANVNLLLGDNGTGKSAVLMAAALAVLAEIIQSTGYRPYFLVRRAGAEYEPDDPPQGINAEIRASLRLHAEDTYPTPAKWEANGHGASPPSVMGQAVVKRRRALETVESAARVNSAAWEGLFAEDAPAFFLVGYGATRRVENAETFDTSVRDRARAMRYQCVAGLFEDYVGLTPVNVWLAALRTRNRLEEGITLLNRVLPKEVQVSENSLSYKEPRFLVRGTSLPFAALSDGFRSFIGWVGDLLFQLNRVIPASRKLTDLHGVVMVDELDLLLHPAWQRTVIDALATAFPRLQFFFTSHSPIVAGTLEAANIFVTEQDPQTGAMTLQPGRENVHGLSADQILTSAYFDLPTPRAPDAVNQMNDLARSAWAGDPAASEEFLRRLTEGFEPVSPPPAERTGRTGKE
jgi:hypothetical protein